MKSKEVEFLKVFDGIEIAFINVVVGSAAVGEVIETQVMFLMPDDLKGKSMDDLTPEIKALAGSFTVGVLPHDGYLKVNDFDKHSLLDITVEELMEVHSIYQTIVESLPKDTDPALTNRLNNMVSLFNDLIVKAVGPDFIDASKN